MLEFILFGLFMVVATSHTSEEWREIFNGLEE